ncbi:DEAD/DEAH box helicase, partial [Candidatus Woesearchaeota archaeon]|nr:DEAD/DEAH box helicase [Candidatus Woesearchaeota archaeon]
MGIKNFKPRLYQQTIFATCSRHNTLVALPTGLGKTAICTMLAAHRLSLYPKSKIIVLAPTRPLIDQHRTTFEKMLDVENYSELSEVLSGFTEPDKRKLLWSEKQIFFSTPQTLQNDIISGKADLSDVSMICFDEAHRAVGDYSYVYIAKQYLKQAKYPRILALTASPGSDKEKIKEIVSNLFIEKIEVRTDKDKDVAPYVQEVHTEWVEVDLPPELKIVHKYLLHCIKTKIADLKKYNIVHNIRHYSRQELLQLQASLQSMIAQGEKSFEVLKSVSLSAEALKAEHALELIETQGLSPLLDYFETIFEQSRQRKTKAVQNLVSDVNFKTAYLKAKQFSEDIEHPKLAKLRQIIQNEIDNNPDVKMIVFSHFRDMASRISKEIALVENAKAAVFVGQAKKKGQGMSQKQQISVLEDFRQGNYNILISTSVGEEGLDIPQVDIVIFYEPVPSAIRKIQRQGRTGRMEKGRVIILVTRDTRDVGYRWSS